MLRIPPELSAALQLCVVLKIRVTVSSDYVYFCILRKVDALSSTLANFNFKSSLVWDMRASRIETSFCILQSLIL
jgi:hypothetical protein